MGIIYGLLVFMVCNFLIMEGFLIMMGFFILGNLYGCLTCLMMYVRIEGLMAFLFCICFMGKLFRLFFGIHYGFARDVCLSFGFLLVRFDQSLVDHLLFL